MKFTTISRRLAATGAATALAASAVVGLTGTTATAAPEVTNDYTCSVPGLAGPYNVVMTTNAVGIEGIPALPAGSVVDAVSVSATNHVTIPAEAYGLFSQFGVDNVTFPDFAADFGTSKVGVTGMAAEVADMTDNGDGTYSFDAPGVNAAFEVPAAGEYDITMPAGFTINANNAEGALLAPIVCNLAEGETVQALHHITVVKNDSTTTGSAAPVEKGETSKVKIKVAAPNETPSGKVVVKKGTNKLDTVTLNAKGRAVFKHKFPVGKTKLTLIYKGDGYTNGSKTADPVIVKVTKP